MLINPQVPLHRLVLSLSEALDHVHESVHDHQRRVAYIATRVARAMGYGGNDLLDVFIASALHDIGLIGVERRLLALKVGDLEAVRWHAVVGAHLVEGHPLLARAADAVLHHHILWADGRGAEVDGRAVPMSAHIIALADDIERHIERSDHVLLQADRLCERVARGAGPLFHPAVADAFRQVSASPAFWLDTVNSRIYGVLLHQVDWPLITVDASTLMPLARIFARVVDAASPWTAVHSAGVAATATALAARMDFSEREQAMMKAAGYLHDIGKLTVPTAVLDKPGALDKTDLASIRGHTYHTFRILDSIGGMPQVNEWAAFHHERLDGTGYPFGHAARDLTLGSRIMAVADVFTALTEDRPYRPGMKREKTMGILQGMARSGALDGGVVDGVLKGYDDIDGIRRAEQETYAIGQEWLARSIG